MHHVRAKCVTKKSVFSHLSHSQVSTHLAIQCRTLTNAQRDIVLLFRISRLCAIFITQFEHCWTWIPHVDAREYFSSSKADRERERGRAAMEHIVHHFLRSMFMLFSFTVYFSWAFLTLLPFSCAPSTFFYALFSVVFLHTFFVVVSSRSSNACHWHYFFVVFARFRFGCVGISHLYSVFVFLSIFMRRRKSSNQYFYIGAYRCKKM